MFIFPTRGIDDGHHSIWFWSVRNLLGVCCKANTIPQRANLPRSIREATSTSSIDLSDWGTPSASYPAPVCDVPRFFTAQQLVFDITLCGIWFGAFLNPAMFGIHEALLPRAGVPSEYDPQCFNSGPRGRCVGPMLGCNG